MENKWAEHSDFLANSLKKARIEKHKSQEFMSLELNIVRKTVQNWERGVSEPTIAQAIKWFQVLNVSPIPYLFQYVHADMVDLSNKETEEKLREMLLKIVRELPVEGMRQLLYLFYGDHGSSPRAIMNMITAHLQTPMKDRVVASNVILKNYEISEKKGQLLSSECVSVNTDFLKHAIEAGERAAVDDAEAYVMVPEEGR